MGTYLYFDPGVPSLLVSYFDTNDFFYSGHIGSSTIYTAELCALGHKKLSLLTFGLTLAQWGFMTVSHSHYFVDMFFGAVVAISCHRMGESLAYYVDH